MTVADTRKGRFWRLGLLAAVVIVLFDQATKWWIVNVLMQPVPQAVEVTPFFNLVLAWNRGVSFGTFSAGGSWMPYALTAVALAIAAVLATWLWRAERWFVALGLGMVIGGAVGNVLDRVRLGAVVDFLDFHAFGWHFWAFNVADSGISVGVVLLLIDGLFPGHEKA